MKISKGKLSGFLEKNGSNINITDQMFFFFQHYIWYRHKKFGILIIKPTKIAKERDFLTYRSMQRWISIFIGSNLMTRLRKGEYEITEEFISFLSIIDHRSVVNYKYDPHKEMKLWADKFPECATLKVYDGTFDQNWGFVAGGWQEDGRRMAHSNSQDGTFSISNSLSNLNKLNKVSNSTSLISKDIIMSILTKITESEALDRLVRLIATQYEKKLREQKEKGLGIDRAIALDEIMAQLKKEGSTMNDLMKLAIDSEAKEEEIHPLTPSDPVGAIIQENKNFDEIEHIPDGIVLLRRIKKLIKPTKVVDIIQGYGLDFDAPFAYKKWAYWFVVKEGRNPSGYYDKGLITSFNTFWENEMPNVNEKGKTKKENFGNCWNEYIEMCNKILVYNFDEIADEEGTVNSMRYKLSLLLAYKEPWEKIKKAIYLVLNANKSETADNILLYFLGDICYQYGSLSGYSTRACLQMREVEGLFPDEDLIIADSKPDAEIRFADLIINL